MLLFSMILEDDFEGQMKFEYIFNMYSKQMFYVAKGVVGNNEDAEDAVQDALIRIASNLESVNTEDAARTRRYVLTAARNAAINILKKPSRFATVDIEDIFDLGCDDVSLASLVEENSAEAIIGCIRDLDPVYRDVLYYRFVEEMSEKEIASLLGRKYGTVKMQVKRGRALLIKSLKKKEVVYHEQLSRT